MVPDRRESLLLLGGLALRTLRFRLDIILPEPGHCLLLVHLVALRAFRLSHRVFQILPQQLQLQALLLRDLRLVQILHFIRILFLPIQHFQALLLRLDLGLLIPTLRLQHFLHRIALQPTLLILLHESQLMRVSLLLLLL